MYLLPRPQEMLLQDNVFYVDYTAEICIDPEASPEWLHYASLLQKEIEQDTGFHLNINRNLPVFQTPSILLKSTSGHSQQEYTLRIRESGILLTASSNSGMLYAIQTLRQIIRQEGKSAVLVTHDLSEAISLADRIIVLSGRPANIRQTVPLIFDLEQDTPLNRRNSPEFKHYFNLIWKELNTDD